MAQPHSGYTLPVFAAAAAVAALRYLHQEEFGDTVSLDLIEPAQIVELEKQINSQSKIIIQGGEGIGCQINQDGKAAVYSYAQRLLQENLQRLLQPEETIRVTLILPQGRRIGLTRC